MGFVRYIARQFGKPTGIGGRLATSLMNLMNRPMYKACLKVIQENSPRKILDVGFGNGYVLQLLNKKINAIQLFGIDISADAVRMAEKRLKSKARLSVGSVVRLDFESDFFDAIYTINTLYFWEEPMKGLNEVKRVLTKDGVFVNVCYTKQWLDKLRYTDFGFNKMNCDELLELHRKVGFSSVQLIDIDAGKSFYILCKK